MAFREPAILSVELGPNGENDVEVDGKPLLCTQVSIEMGSNSREVVLRIPFEFCKVDARLSSDAPIMMQRLAHCQAHSRGECKCLEGKAPPILVA